MASEPRELTPDDLELIEYASSIVNDNTDGLIHTVPFSRRWDPAG